MSELQDDSTFTLSGITRWISKSASATGVNVTSGGTIWIPKSDETELPIIPSTDIKTSPLKNMGNEILDTISISGGTI